MPVTESGSWIPVLNERQIELFNCYKKYCLISGPRKSSKTRGVEHRIVRHCWEVDNAKVAIFGTSAKNILEGIYDELVTHVLPEWEENLENFQVLKVGVSGATRMSYIRVTNQHGGVSEIQVHSIDDETKVAKKLKGTFFSCVWVSELTSFKTRAVFDYIAPQLRHPSCPKHLLQWYGDTNPCEEEGQDHWAYKLFFNERMQEDHPVPSFQKNLHVLQFSIEDNTFLTKEDKEEIEAMYRHDPDLYAAMVKGEWVRTVTGAMFSDVFSKQRHVIGDASGDPDEWDIIVPSEKTVTLYAGFDLGQTNHAVVFMEKIVDLNGNVTWCVLDEVVHVGEQITIEDVTLEVCEKMDEIEARAGRKFEWVCWSDSSADMYRSSIGAMESMIVARASGGRIQLNMAQKAAGSVRMRVNLLRQALQQSRFFVSAQCAWMIEALSGGAKRGTRKNEFLKNNRFKHVVDSAGYVQISEAPFDLQFQGPSVGKGGFDGIVGVQL